MYERILVPLDGSRLAEVALDHAAQIARRFESHLYLLRVVSPFDTLSSPGTGPLSPEGEEAPTRIDLNRADAEVKAANEYLNTLRDNLQADGIASTVMVLEGEAVPEILDYAESAGISLIVMSTHGRGGLKRSPFGSVAGSILQGSKIPLHVIPYR
jgi:nucleotide-binding universal stress UspA family protein